MFNDRWPGATGSRKNLKANPKVKTKEKNKITVAARDTLPARTRAREVMEALDGIAYDWIALDAADAPDDLLCRGEADIALHEASSLSYPVARNWRWPL